MGSINGLWFTRKRISHQLGWPCWCQIPRVLGSTCQNSEIVFMHVATNSMTLSPLSIGQLTVGFKI